jgi:hypothetical protein
MESVILSKEHLLVLGDFNIHFDVSDDADAVKFHDLLESLGLEQHVTKSTYIHGHILDLVITRKTENTIPFPPRKRLKRLKNHVTYISNKGRREFYAQFIHENGNYQNRLFRATNALLQPKDALCFPDYSDDTSLANDIGHFSIKRSSIYIPKELDAVVIDQCDSS